jgi:ribosomal protein L32E
MFSSKLMRELQALAMDSKKKSFLDVGKWRMHKEEQWWRDSVEGDKAVRESCKGSVGRPTDSERFRANKWQSWVVRNSTAVCKDTKTFNCAGDPWEGNAYRV